MRPHGQSPHGLHVGTLGGAAKSLPRPKVSGLAGNAAELPGPRSRGARVHARPCQGCKPCLRTIAASGLVLATQEAGSVTGQTTRFPATSRVMPLRAVLFDVDFTIAKPGPDLGPEGYQRLGQRFGLELEPERYGEARAHAVSTIERHPELDHDEQVWVLFTEQIIRGMGGNSDRAYECAVEMTRAWEHAQNFQIFEDVLPVLAVLRADGLKVGLVSNTGRNLEDFVAHHGLDVDAGVSSGAHGKTKP